jgi:hypothetical protein
MTRTRLFAEHTKVAVIQSRGEIERLLSQHKAEMFGTAVDYGANTARVQFRAHSRIVRFTVPLPDRSKFGDGARREQEERRIWRALLLVIKAKLESVESKIATFEEEFLAHIVMPNDRTVADIILPQIAESYSTGRMIVQGYGNGARLPDGWAL